MNLWQGQMSSIAWAWEHGRMFQTSGLFMLGMIMGRKRLFLFSDKNMKFWLGVLSLALVCYFPLTGLKNMLPGFVENAAIAASLNLIIQSLANFSFMFVLVSLVILLFYSSGKIKNMLLNMAPYGRMSLTNYLTQSIAGSMLFYNWGFGLHRHLGITYSFLVGICLFVLQFAFCRWWIKRRSHGPFEYIWKKGTWIGKNKIL
jgi:uncharacterized protein